MAAADTAKKRRLELPKDPDDAERDHFFEVCWSCLQYRQDARREARRIQASVQRLSEEDMALWKGTDLQQWTRSVDLCIEENARFLDQLPIPDVCGAQMSQQHAMMVRQPPPQHRAASRNLSRVRTTLRQFVRDWAAEGQVERDATYTPLVEALGRHLPLPGKGQRKPRVLCPGSGLGRLPFDLARLGYAAEGNEFSYHMILGMHLMYQRTRAVGQFTIYPFVLHTTNRSKSGDNLRAVAVPDMCPCRELPRDSQMSFAAGEFIAVYESQLQEWDAVATAFFLDTAKNVFLYIRTIAAILRPGGLWTNLGPLLFHYADVDNEISIELSWEEIRPFICRYFTIVEEERREANYTMTAGGLMRTLYKCVFFSAIRNQEASSGVGTKPAPPSPPWLLLIEEPVTGKSKPVY